MYDEQMIIADCNLIEQRLKHMNDHYKKFSSLVFHSNQFDCSDFSTWFFIQNYGQHKGVS